MRISDWSSDVCSSDLPVADLAAIEAPTWLDRKLASGAAEPVRDIGFGREVRTAIVARRQWLVEQQLATGAGTNFRLREGALENLRQRELAATGKRLSEQLGKKFEPPRTGRSEENTSELQSLMRISSAVFCL